MDRSRQAISKISSSWHIRRSNTFLKVDIQQRQQEVIKNFNKLPKHNPAVIKSDITCTVINVLNLFKAVQDLQIGLLSD